MKQWRLGGWICLGTMLLFLSLPGNLAAQAAPANFPPLTSGENLTYKISWPSGLPLGEATLSASGGARQIHISLTIDAEFPANHATYSFTSTTDPELCSIRFAVSIRQGTRSLLDDYSFDQQNHQLRRIRNGRTSVTDIPECARDPLALFYFLRKQAAAQQLGMGQTVAGSFFLSLEGSASLEHDKPAETVPFSTKNAQGDGYVVSYSGGSGAEGIFEMWLRADPSLTPVAFKAELPLATFTAELQ